MELNSFNSLIEILNTYKSFYIWFGSISFGIFLFSLLSIKWLAGLIPEDYFINKLIPSYEKQYKGATLSLIKGIRGQNEGSLGMVWIFESDDARNLYYDYKGSPTELNQEVSEKLGPVNEGLNEIGTWTSNYTDWSVY